MFSRTYRTFLSLCCLSATCMVSSGFWIVASLDKAIIETYFAEYIDKQSVLLFETEKKLETLFASCSVKLNKTVDDCNNCVDTLCNDPVVPPSGNPKERLQVLLKIEIPGKLLAEPIKALTKLASRLSKKAAKIIKNSLKKVAKTVGKGAKKVLEHVKKVGKVLKKTGRAFGRVIKKTGRAFGRVIKKTGRALGTGIKHIARGTKKLLKSIAKKTKTFAKRIFKSIGHGAKRVFKSVGHGAKRVFKSVGHGAKRVFKSVGHGAKRVFKSIGHGARKVVGRVRNVVSKIGRGVGRAFRRIWGKRKRRSVDEIDPETKRCYAKCSSCAIMTISKDTDKIKHVCGNEVETTNSTFYELDHVVKSLTEDVLQGSLVTVQFKLFEVDQATKTVPYTRVTGHVDGTKFTYKSMRSYKVSGMSDAEKETSIRELLDEFMLKWRAQFNKMYNY